MANRLSRSLDHIEAHTPSALSGASTDGGVVSKNGEQIEQGDHVHTRIRGGRHEGYVCSVPPQSFYCTHEAFERKGANVSKVEGIVTSKEKADAGGVKNPPKVRSRSGRSGELK
jgi:hypothetical protein